jgi:hypothetical protein
METPNINEVSARYETLKWFKCGWYRKFKKTEFIKGMDMFNHIYHRALISKERFCSQFGYDEDDSRSDNELL